MTGRTYQNSRIHFQTGMPSKQALFREYPNARKPFISSADLGKFVDKKCQHEIHTLDEFAAFHWEFKRPCGKRRLTKEKESVLMVLTGSLFKLPMECSELIQGMDFMLAFLVYKFSRSA